MLHFTLIFQINSINRKNWNCASFVSYTYKRKQMLATLHTDLLTEEYDTRTAIQTKFKLSFALSPLCDNKTIIAPQMEVYKISMFRKSKEVYTCWRLRYKQLPHRCEHPCKPQGNIRLD